MSEKMPVSRHTRTIPFRLKALSAVVLSTALLSSAAYGASLGRINVLSALGQPLQADIELHSTTREQAETLKVRLASLETFRIANIEYNPVLSALRFNVEDRNGRPVIRVSSTRPINEPFVDLLLEVEGSGGRLVREYTFILDPVDMRRAQPVQMAAPAPVAPVTQSRSVTTTAPAPVPVVQAEPAAAAVIAVPASDRPSASEAAPLAQRSAPAVRVAPQAMEAGTDVPSSHTVVRGDTLGKIAREVAPEGVSLDQMLVALHRANPQAFVDNNMNRLRSGRILTIPDAEAARAVPEVEARRIVVAQAADFNQYKERLASQVAASSPVMGETARQSDGGRITAQVEETGSPTASAQDRLQLSKSGVAAGGDSAGMLAAGAEERIALEKALAEEKQRVAELEKNLTAMQRLLQLQNQELAERQAQSQPLAEQQAPVASVAPVAASAAETEVAATAAMPDSSIDTAAAAQSAEETQPAALPETPVAPVATAKPPVVAVPPVVEQPSFLEHMLGHPMLLPLTGILAALGLVGVVVRRRRKQQDALARDSFVQGNSLFGSTGGQSVDTNNSVFSTNFSPSASQLDTNEVDPIAEADVYIAYQKDDQAEEILKDALRAQPARHNVRLKLLELYKRRKDAVAFAVCAKEMFALTRGRGEDWAQAAILGRELDPDNSMYAETSASVESSEQDNPSTEELDLGALLNSTRMPANAAEEGVLSMESGGMNFGSEPAKAADDNSLDFALRDDKEEAEQVAGSESSLNEWDVESDIAQMKAEAEKSQADTSFVSGDDEESAATIDDENAGAHQALEFDISDISLDFNPAGSSGPGLGTLDGAALLEAELNGRAQELTDPLAELVPSAEGDERASNQDDSEAIDNPFDFSSPVKQSASTHVVHEPLLDLDIPELSSSSDKQDDLGLSLPAAGVSLGEDSQMWEEFQDEVALAQATVPMPSLGPISAEAELSTKLDLAVAYREIGDKEGARELLEEVVASGHPEYTSKAQNLLQKIA